MIGEHLSHYKLIERLGAGGMGVVYKAQDTKLERLVAIKLLNAAAVANPDRVQRFVQEAKTTSALNHPSITTIHQLGEANGQHFITMEYVEGENLRQRLRRGPLETRHVLELGIQVAEGLAAAHAAGIVHRDLKPENIMLRTDGLAKILDFGLAKLLQDAEPGPALQAAAAGNDETILQPSLGTAPSGCEPTLPGMVMGTVGYMAPEQVRGERVDARSDIFALGCVLYEITTGQRPFGTGSPIEVMHAILKDPARPVHDLRPEAPVELERILRKTMAKDPEERYQNAKDLAIDLRALRREVESGALSATYAPISGAHPKVAPAKRSRRLVFLLGAGVVAATLAVVLLLRLRPGTPPASQPLQFTKVTSSGHADGPAISPDGKYVAYVVNEDGKDSIWMRQLATASGVQLVPAAEVTLSGLAFSPDGNWLHYLSIAPGARIHLLYQIPTLGGTPRKLYEDVDSPASFAPDGKRFVYMRHVPPYQSEIYIGDADASRPPQLLVGKSDTDYLLSPRWSPDGKSIAVILRDTRQPGLVHLAQLAASGGQPSRIGATGWAAISGYCWAPDGSGLYLTGKESSQDPSSQLHFVRLRDGTVRQLTTDLNSYSGVGASADGKTLVTLRSLTTTNMWIVPARGSAAENTSGAKQITSSTAQVQWPTLSPDGKSIAYVSDAAGNADIWAMNIDGGNSHPLTSGPALELMPAWSPDGRRIAYAMVRDDTLSIWVMDAEGGNPIQLVRGQCAVPTWSADSQWILYHQSVGITPAVWKVAAGGGTPVQVVPPWSAFPRWSPDGTQILCWVLEDPQTGIPKIAVVPAGGGKPIATAAPFDFKNYTFTWTADGKGVTVHSSKGGASNLVRYPLDGGPPQPLTDFPAGISMFTWAWLPDGSALACSRGNVTQDVVLLQNFR